MIDIQKSLIVQQNIDFVFDKLYEDNAEIFKSQMKIIKWDRHNWCIKRKHKQRKEEIYMYIPSMPDDVIKYTHENDRYLNIQVKNKIIIDSPMHKKIKTKFKILNVNPIMRTLMNELNIIKTKNVIELTQMDNNSTNIIINIHVSLKIPGAKTVEQFIANLIENLIENALNILKENIK